MLDVVCPKHIDFGYFTAFKKKSSGDSKNPRRKKKNAFASCEIFDFESKVPEVSGMRRCCSLAMGLSITKELGHVQNKAFNGVVKKALRFLYLK